MRPGASRRAAGALPCSFASNLDSGPDRAPEIPDQEAVEGVLAALPSRREAAGHVGARAEPALDRLADREVLFLDPLADADALLLTELAAWQVEIENNPRFVD